MNCCDWLPSVALTLSICAGAAYAASPVDISTPGSTLELAGLNQEKLARTFQGYEASFVLLDTKAQRYLRYNPELCLRRMPPMSTFKIFNALVGLEAGILKDENHPMKWDGTKYDISSWNRDQTLQSAITNSVVWYFQQLARAVGEERMKEFIHQGHYGNEDISGGITRFWLASTLAISADEQVEFLKRLINDDLPFSGRSMAIVRGLIRLDQTDKGTLYGKTGTDFKDGKMVLGWFVGYVVQGQRIFAFATNIQAPDDAGGKKARELTQKILSQAGLF